MLTDDFSAVGEQAPLENIVVGVVIGSSQDSISSSSSEY